MISKFQRAIAAFKAETGWDAADLFLLVDAAKFQELNDCFQDNGRGRLPDQIEIDGAMFASWGDYNLCRVDKHPIDIKNYTDEELTVLAHEGLWYRANFRNRFIPGSDFPMPGNAMNGRCVYVTTDPKKMPA